MSESKTDLDSSELFMSIGKIIQGLNEFQTTYFNTHQELFQQLSQGQTPDILLITCSDSRIDPNLLTQTKPGELFIIRNIGNMIPPHGTLNSSEGAGIEYAVAALDIKHVVVCGHSHCGSMKALLQLNKFSEEMPLVYDWLKHHGEPVRRLLKENYANSSEDELLKIAIEENVLTQIENLETYPVIRSKMHSGQIFLHAWVYSIETGKIYAYDANKGEFDLLSSGPFPVPNPLSIHHQ
jgi:carbonic anhydrase